MHFFTLPSQLLYGGDSCSDGTSGGKIETVFELLMLSKTQNEIAIKWGQRCLSA
jgi:hypothetical protein